MAGDGPSGRPAQVHGRWLLLEKQHEAELGHVPLPRERPDISCPTQGGPSDISAPVWEGGGHRRAMGRKQWGDLVLEGRRVLFSP